MTAKYATLTVEQLSMNEVLQDVLKIARKHWLQVPTRLAMLFKAMAMAEGAGAQLDSTFNLPDKFVPYARDYVLERPAWERRRRHLRESGLDVLALTSELPIRMRRILKDLERGGLGVNIRHAGLDGALQHFDRAINRLMLALFVAASIVGIGVVLSVADIPGKSTWLLAYLVAGLAIVLGVGARLAWRLARSKS